jgi:hypothetical protein
MNFCMLIYCQKDSEQSESNIEKGKNKKKKKKKKKCDSLIDNIISTLTAVQKICIGY